ncbi:MAG: hypothetical protein PWP16_1081 [Eubacteriaceae bacterium]|nr:hypothetical protein [Eubacteriaceae bacterium]MDK2905111.1 hypothetical protein [Eubacteriaceae bacterium]MDK2936213.1 hypothetical protein [Eubacteriaceae bacterium]MDK2962273.1 hypothetical protein [Eubacteriaceae bacterium]MDN5307718.1 hypothetical protein [Eubacteriaceae bacterium]
MEDSNQKQRENQVMEYQEFTQEDIEDNKVMAALAYILFFLPLIVCPESAYGKFHANQGLVLLIVSVAGSIVLGIISAIIPFIGWIVQLIFSLAVLAFAILGIVNALNGKANKLPLIGEITILK